MAQSPPPPTLRLTDGIGIARFEDFVIVLDVPFDRYRKIGGDAGAALIAVAHALPLDRHRAALAELYRSELITTDPPSDAPFLDPRSIPVPNSSELEGGAASRAVNCQDLSVVLDCTASRLHLRRRPLGEVLRAIPHAGPGHREIEIGELARAFDMGRRLAPWRPRCLPDALAFTRRARRYGHEVRLVFGVKDYPFEAHCWAQIADIVLTDPLERVLRFQAILAV